MRILFAGSPAIAIPSLELLSKEHEIVGILTNPDSQAGRGRRETRTAVAEAAASLIPSAPILTPARLDADFRNIVAALRPELLVVFAFSRIFGPKFLELFPRGAINAHPSLLPKYRGAAPINAAILNREGKSGVTIQRLALKMDSGDILAQEPIELDPRETTASLTQKSASIGAKLLSRVTQEIQMAKELPRPQNEEEASYCPMLKKDDGLIDWSRSCLDIDAMIRAYDPWPGSYTRLSGVRLNILEALPLADRTSPESVGVLLGIDKALGILVQTGMGLLAVRRLQLESKKPLDHIAFSNGFRALAGSRLES